jgi:putative methyltransferase (TIGR04325 family)
MSTLLKSTIRNCIPPIVYAGMQHIRQPSNTGFWGRYDTFEQAQKASAGYDEAHILEKALAATMAVAQGSAKAERDTVLFDKPLYTFPLFATLLKWALALGRPIRVCDFGGALGSTYFQFADFLGKHPLPVEWVIVEQPHFVACGQQYFENEHLSFKTSIEAMPFVDVLILSSVLQYLPMPYQMLENLMKKAPEVICIDRTPFWLKAGDRITIQKVPPNIYEASYPCWLLDRARIHNLLDAQYTRVFEEVALEGTVVTRQNRCRFESIIAERKH